MFANVSSGHDGVMSGGGGWSDRVDTRNGWQVEMVSYCGSGHNGGDD